MEEQIFSLILKSAENSFIEVTVFVGAVLMIFGYINFKNSGKLIETIEKSKKTQPIIGAFLGLTPGCGGAIFVMPLFPKGTITFGTVIATLIATMGDSAFVLMSVMPGTYIVISIISFIVGVITGYIVDQFNLGKQLQDDIKKRWNYGDNLNHNNDDHNIYKEELNMKADDIHIGHSEGDPIDIALHHNTKGHQSIDTIGYKITHGIYPIYWIFIAVGLILGIMDLFQADINKLFIPNLGKFIGVLGTFLSLFTMIMSNKFIQNDTHEESEFKAHSLQETIVHNAQETAFVATWVFFAYLAYELFIFLILGKGNYVLGESILTKFLSQTGFKAVIIGALIGIIPGCGPQIIFVTLYTKGFLPFSALLANAISQDGDALFPLIAVDRKSALWSTIINTITALIVGIIFYLIEVNI